MVIYYRKIYRRKCHIFVNFRFHAETLMTILKVKTSRQKKLLRMHTKYSNVEIFRKFESKRAIHNEDLISRLIR